VDQAPAGQEQKSALVGRTHRTYRYGRHGVHVTFQIAQYDETADTFPLLQFPVHGASS
jgi:hypothetical protein